MKHLCHIFTTFAGKYLHVLIDNDISQMIESLVFYLLMSKITRRKVYSYWIHVKIQRNITLSDGIILIRTS